MTADKEAAEAHSPEKVRRKVEKLIRNFETELAEGELRSKVLALVPVFNSMRDLGKALIPPKFAPAARERILYYFQQYPREIIGGDELLVVSGIQEYARRVRELRVQFGWAIASGMTIKEMTEDPEEDVPEKFKKMKPNDYVLLKVQQDRDAAHRWNIANTIRKKNMSVRAKILEYLRSNTGKAVTNEELRYVARGKTEWARRVRELRTEYGWPIVTQTTGDPELAVGEYMLQADRQNPEHDRHISDKVRREVLRRDGYGCDECKWSHDEWHPSDPRILELHHIRRHSKGGKNTKDNLRTLCNVCHDNLHSQSK